MTFCCACGIIYIQGKGESENANRVAVRETHQKPFIKFVQVYHLTNSKKYDIIYTERKERTRKAQKGKYKMSPLVTQSFSTYYIQMTERGNDYGYYQDYKER